jgi:hypothetical protein
MLLIKGKHILTFCFRTLKTNITVSSLMHCQYEVQPSLPTDVLASPLQIHCFDWEPSLFYHYSSTHCLLTNLTQIPHFNLGFVATDYFSKYFEKNVHFVVNDRVSIANFAYDCYSMEKFIGNLVGTEVGAGASDLRSRQRIDFKIRLSFL